MQDLYQEVTNKICAALESGTAPWIRPWTAGTSPAAGMPHNPASGTVYRGINVTLLWIAEQEGGFASSEWMTYKQAQALGAQVRHGERGAKVGFPANRVEVT